MQNDFICFAFELVYFESGDIDRISGKLVICTYIDVCMYVCMYVCI